MTTSNLYNCSSTRKVAFERYAIIFLFVFFSLAVIAAETEEEKESPWLLVPTNSSDPRLGSPVAMDYLDRAPFEFNGKIEKVHISYVD